MEYRRLTTQEKIVILQEDLGSSSIHLGDLNVEKFGSNQTDDIRAWILVNGGTGLDKGVPFERLYTIYLLSL
jgi:hypothetical protein